MILGTGTDLVDIRRIEKLIDSSNFIQKIFTENEISNAKLITNTDKRNFFFAKRFSAKESFSKAIGTGFGEVLAFKDIEIFNNDKGAPFIEVSSNVDTYIKELHAIKSYNINLSLTDEYPYAQSFVILSK